MDLTKFNARREFSKLFVSAMTRTSYLDLSSTNASKHFSFSRKLLLIGSDLVLCQDSMKFVF